MATVATTGTTTTGGSVLRTEHGAQAAAGVVTEAPFARYELRIPVPALANGRALRASCLINENDGGERIGWLEWTPGIGQGGPAPSARSCSRRGRPRPGRRPRTGGGRGPAAKPRTSGGRRGAP
jgi:hypothetical protein